MKKIFITVFVIVMCAALVLTGCNKDKNETDTNMQDNTVTEDMNKGGVVEDANENNVDEDMNNAANPSIRDNTATTPPADDMMDNNVENSGIITDDGTADGTVQ